MKKLFFLFLLIPALVSAQIQTINIGATANDGTGDKLRQALRKVNENFVYTMEQVALKADATALSSHIGNNTNPHSVTKAQVGLGNVENTADADKPVSTATSTAISSVSATLSAHTSSTSNPHSVTKTQVGLGNVDNTSDVTKFTNTNLTGVPTAPTASNGTSTGQIATTSFVQNSLTAATNLRVSNTQTDNYTIALSDVGKVVEVSKATSVSLSIPTNASIAFPVGSMIFIKRTGAGVLTVSALDGGTTTINNSSGGYTDPGQNTVYSIRKTATDTWDLQNGAPQAYSNFVSTYSGFSSDPSGGPNRYTLQGKMCQWYVNPTSTGTSNATSFTITMPFAAFNNMNYPVTIVNSGTVSIGRMVTTAGSNVASFVQASGTAFTASGAKSAIISVTYEIQ